MRDLARNKQKIYYALKDVATETDEWGNTTDVKTYGIPTELLISISSDKGNADVQGFGLDLKYDRQMITHDMNCPIDELAHLWVGIEKTEPYNYEVVAVSKSLNCIKYAIRRVDVK